MRLAIAMLAAAAVAVSAFLGLFALGAGVAWICVFGDDPWPEWSRVLLLVPPAVGALYYGVKAFRAVMRRLGVS